MMIDRATLTAALQQYQRQEEQALADANAAHGAQVALQALLNLLDEAKPEEARLVDQAQE